MRRIFINPARAVGHPLFMRADQVEAAWRLLMPVFEVWAVAPPSDFPNYAAETWGPEDTQGLPAQGHN